MLRLGQEIHQAVETHDWGRAAHAQRQMRKIHLERPSSSCRLLIREDCRAATAILQAGSSVDVPSRIKAARKLGRWLRWGRASTKDLVPTHTALNGLLCALRSEPEVAWAAQCSLFHAARCSDGSMSVRNGTRGTLSRLLLNEPTPFPLCLPQPIGSAVEMYDRAFRTNLVRDFISQLQSLALTDPGYDMDPKAEDAHQFVAFAKFLGRNIGSLKHLRLLGFDDGALTLFLPHMRMPRLKTLHLVGACHTEESQRAILGAVHRHRSNLEELVLNVWTEFLHEADDPLVDLPVMPSVKRLAVRAPPPIAWEDFARKFPALEELTLLYHQDFAINVVEMLENEDEDLSSGSDAMERHVRWLYYDVVTFARDLHSRGFRRLARRCTKLRLLRLAVADTSQGADHTPPDEQMAITWVRDPEAKRHFCRDEVRSNEARAALQSLSKMCGDTSVDPEIGYLTEDQAMAAGASVMLQVARLFDDPSLEASLGLA